MSGYQVDWLQSALDELAAIWTDAADRSTITRAAAEIDRELSVDPDRRGVELHEGLRVLVISPLRVIFTVNRADRSVEVVSVRRV